MLQPNSGMYHAKNKVLLGQFGEAERWKTMAWISGKRKADVVFCKGVRAYLDPGLPWEYEGWRIEPELEQMRYSSPTVIGRAYIIYSMHLVSSVSYNGSYAIDARVSGSGPKIYRLCKSKHIVCGGIRNMDESIHKTIISHVYNQDHNEGAWHESSLR